jgi:hypothetical protein
MDLARGARLGAFPAFAHLLDRLASFSRLIIFDKRGTGLSDLCD